MSSKNIQNLPESFELFKRKFLFALDKANKSDTTIFSENVDISKITDEVILEHYSYFNKNHRDAYFAVKNNDSNDRINIINQSITESFFQNNFNEVLDTILESGQITLSAEYILENTVKEFNLDLEKVGMKFLDTNSTNSTDSTDSKSSEVIEENVFGAMASMVGLSAGLGLGATFITSGAVALAAALLMPARESNQFNVWVEKWFGKVVSTVIGSGNIFDTSLTPGLAQSHQNIIKFDNIQADDSVKKLFLKIQKTGMNVKEVRNGLESVVTECLANNKDILSMDPDQKESIIDILQKPFNASPDKYNVLKLIWKAIFGEANEGKEGYGTLIRFRKCLSNKLVDIYKLLLISNLQNNKDHKRIMDSIVKSNNRPEQILSFLPGDTDEDERLKDAVLSLVQFRIYLMELANNLEKGFFDVDREAGKYLKQKLSMVDGEVESYLRLNSNKFRNTFEGNLMSRKPINAKRDLLSLGSNL